MLRRILEKSGTAEVLFREIATICEPIKKRIKRVLRRSSKSEVAVEKNETKINSLRQRLENSGISKGDIVLIHSSLDGLRSLGMTSEEIVDLILDIFSEMTVVFATYPIEPIRKKEVYKYDPKKTLCWTGMLPNVFLKRQGVKRSLFPYNTLAAIGEHADAMLDNNLLSDIPHGANTPWDYCRMHHAKILFLGTTSRESNTMAIHMVPDIKGDDWPINNWYEERKYIITYNGEKIEKTIRVQKGFWYKYVNEYKTDRVLKDSRLLLDIGIDDIPLEIVPDSYLMMEFLENRVRQGVLMYSIPRKFYKK